MIKKGFLTRDVIIAAMLFSTIVALFILGIAGISDEYDTDIIINEDFSEKYDRLQDLSGKVEIGRNASSSATKLKFLGSFDVVFQSTFTVIQTIFSSLGLIGDVTEEFKSDTFGFDLGVVNIVFISALAILTVVIVFVWISSIARGRI